MKMLMFIFCLFTVNRSHKRVSGSRMQEVGFRTLNQSSEVRGGVPVGGEGELGVVAVQSFTAAVVEVDGEGEDGAERDGRQRLSVRGVETRTGAQSQVRHGHHLRTPPPR